MRVFHQKSSTKAKEYYSSSDYYQSGPENLKGQWIGDGAKRLGLEGEVEQSLFDRLCDNLHPFEDKRLTLRNTAQRRVLSDITFSVPKSVSVLFAASPDESKQDILDAVRHAADATFHDLEQDALTRVNHERGKLTTRPTHNLVAASWIHLTARPVDDPVFGVHPDPQLHVHFATLNATHTGNDRWTAVDLSNVVRDSGYFEELFQSRLATNIKALGYSLQRTENNFEVSGISRETIDRFSRRTAEIDRLVADGVAEKIAAKEKISIKDAKDQVGARSRHVKSDRYSIEELQSVWRERFTTEEQSQLKAVTNRQLPQLEPTVTKEAAVDFATSNRFERESVTRERQLIRDALKRSMGDVTAEDIRQEVKRRNWIREGEGADALISTKEVLAEEQALLNFARNGRGRQRPLAPHHKIQRDWLSDEQKNAVTGLLNSNDRLQILRGVAGVGKTTLMIEAISGIEQAGTPVTVLAPGVQAAHEVLADEGFRANTLARFLVDEKLQESARGGVVWIDEAGQAGIQDMTKLTRIADKIDARIILSGDKRQHKSVARGAPLRLLESQAGIQPHEVTQIRRQQGEFRDRYRNAVSHLSRGEVLQGFDLLNDMEFVHELPNEERNQQIAKAYADNFEAGKDTLVIAPTHTERAVVTDAIREEMKSRGHIHHDEHHVQVLKSRRLTEAQRTDSINYSADDVVEFVKRGKGGFKPGERLRVIEVRGNRVLADSDKGIVEVPIDSPRSFDVYRWDDARFAAGDMIRITKQNRSKKLYNGSLLRLDGFDSDGNLQLSNGQKVDPDWGHIDNGITVTSHASQGKTYKRVLVAQSSMSFPASTPEQMYVTASRGVERVDIFTDDIEGLRNAIKKSRPNLMASELASANQQNQQQARLTSRVHELRLRAKEFGRKQLRRVQDWLQTQPELVR